MHNDNPGETAPSAGAELVALAASGPPPPAPPRPLASFITQLIACHGRLPAYRERRRAAPDVARESYREAARPAPARRRFERRL